MANTRKIRHDEIFTIAHALTLGIVIFIGASLALVVRILGPALDSLAVPQVDTLLWGIEGALYLVLAILLARSVPGSVLGLVLGYVLRLVVSALMLLLTSAPMTELFVFGSNKGAYHAMAVLVAAIALAAAFRNLLATVGVKREPSNLPSKAQVRFAFDTARQTPPPASASARTKTPVRVPLVLDDAPAEGEAEKLPPTHLMPPEDFVVPKPREEIIGTVTIPISVVLDAVPEARPLLPSAYNVPIRLAHVVPQLPRATVWLTWRQVFEKGAPPAPQSNPMVKEAEFLNRWIRIEARHYATQVPREYYQTVPTPPAWMKLPAVEQEADIKFQAEA